MYPVAETGSSHISGRCCFFRIGWELCMSIVKGTVEVTLNLNKSTCYFLRTGRCSLSIVRDFSISSSSSCKIMQNDLLYCPRLYQLMKSHKSKPIVIIPCQCGHGQVVSGQQRACIAGQKRLELEMKAEGDTIEPACRFCTGQMTFDGNAAGQRIVTVRALVHND